MPEIAPAGIDFGRAAVLGRPIIGQLHLGIGALALALRILVGGKEDQREAPLLAVHPPHLPEAQQLEKGDRGVGIRHADHGVEVTHAAKIGVPGPERQPQMSRADARPLRRVIIGHAPRCTIAISPA